MTLWSPKLVMCACPCILRVSLNKLPLRFEKQTKHHKLEAHDVQCLLIKNS